MSEMKKVAALEGVVFNYPAGNNALDKINLDLNQGEIVGLVGANGAGKTTLMKILAGYMEKSDGSIQYSGRAIEDFSNKKLNEFVNLVEQNPESQLVGPTVEDELARACRLMGYEGRVIREKVDFVLKLVRMKQAKEWYLDEMSCGERRRIALAMALIADPSLLLLDEPLSDLDQVGVKDTVATLRELRSRGLCIVVSSHRLEDILQLTDRVAVLGEGRLLMVDEPQKVLASEETLKMASVNLPAIPSLFLRLKAEGVLASAILPLSMDQAVERIKEAVSLKLEATQALSAAIAEPEKAKEKEAEAGTDTEVLIRAESKTEAKAEAQAEAKPETEAKAESAAESVAAIEANAKANGEISNSKSSISAKLEL
jgi:energy-coupling factor transporter ATP-binding protein EcfA2